MKGSIYMDVSEVFSRRERELNEVLRDCEHKLLKAPAGRLKVRHVDGKDYYYHCKKRGDKSGVYIKKSEHDKARRLAQRDYEIGVKDAVEKELDAIASYKRKMPKKTYEYTYDDFIPGRKKLITPHFMPDEEYVKTWLAESYEPLPEDFDKEVNGAYGFDDSETPAGLEPVKHYTDRGEVVRSKSEVMIANALNKAGIPYKYECPVVLGNDRLYPDFTILKMPERKIFYWEHLGKLDKERYVNRNMWKLDTYEANGIFLGDSMIISRETRERPLNSKEVWTLIEHYLM